MRDLVLIGGGEHARVLADTVQHAGVHRLLGYVDPNPYAAVESLGLVRLGTDEALRDYPDAELMLAFGAAGPGDRRVHVARQFVDAGRRFATIIHPHAVVSSTAVIGAGTFVNAGAVVQTGARIGTHVLVNSGAIVEHDVRLGDHVLLAPGAVVGGGASVGSQSFIGMRAAVRDHVRVGARVTIGMGAAVLHDLADDVVAVGVPARLVPRSMPSLRASWP